MVKRMGKHTQLIINKHAANSGLSTHQAEGRFIEEAMELQEYGIHFYTVCKVCALLCSGSSVYMWLIGRLVDWPVFDQFFGIQLKW